MKLSASKMERAVQCPLSFSLSQVDDVPSEHANKGSALHAYLMRAVKHGKQEALAATPVEHRAACAAIDLDWLAEVTGHTKSLRFHVEVAMGWDPIRGVAKVLATEAEHGHGSDEWPVTGVADLIVEGGNATIIIDYKTGWKRVVPASENFQMHTLALMWCRARGVRQVDVGILYVNERRALPLDHAHYDEMAIDGIESGLRLAYRQVQAPPSTVKPGPWCRYCPAFSVCPSKVSLLLAASGKDVMGPLAQGEVALAYRRLQDLKALTGHLQAQLQNYVDQKGPVDLGNGMLWGPRQSSREYLDGPKTFVLLREKYGADVAIEASSVEITKQKLREALRPVAKEAKVPLVQVERATLEMVRSHGGAQTKESTTYREYKPTELNTEE